MNYRADLLYVYLLIFHFTDSELSVLTGFPFKPQAVYQNTNYRMRNLVGLSSVLSSCMMAA